MTEIVRFRDCVVFSMGDTTTVTVSSDMIANGWAGGQGVQWVGTSVDDRVVTYSTGFYGGILLEGSEEVGARYTAMTDQQLTYHYATLMFGGALISTPTYERYTYASRLVGPLVPIIYKSNDILYLSSRGLWTNEDEMSLQAPPNPDAPAFFAGFVAQIPKPSNNYWLGIQTSM